MGFLNHMFILQESSYYSSQWPYQCTFPPRVQADSVFSIPSPAFIVWRFFDNGHSDQVEVIPHCSFDLHLPNNGQNSPFQASTVLELRTSQMFKLNLEKAEEPEIKLPTYIGS